jgi:polysaccharide pyruvyl transferase CsaB
MTKDSKTVLIAGAPTICWPNAGDEAIFAAMVRELRSAVPGIEITVASCNPIETLERYGVKGFPFHDIGRLIRAASSADLMILGGGSIFYDYWGFDPSTILTKNHQGLSFYTGFALLASLLNRPLMIYGVGVGPLQTSEGKYFTRLAFEQAHTVTVRDSESKALLESLGIDVTKVQVTADPVFNLQNIESEITGEILRLEEKSKLARPLIGVALRNWDVGVNPAVWEREVAGALDAFIERHGGTPLFIPLHKRLESPLTDDRSVAERVSRLMRHGDRAIVFPDEFPPEEKAGLLKGCELVLGMRLHAVIFAVKGGVPTVALTYDPKVRSALRSLDCEQYGLDLEQLTSEKLSALLDRAYTNRLQLRTLLNEKCRTLYLQSLENPRLAAELLSGESVTRSALSPLTVDFLRSFAVDHVLRLDERQAAAGLATSTHQAPLELERSLEQARQNASTFDTEERQHKEETLRAASNAMSRRRRIAILTNLLLDWDTHEPRFGGGERYCLTLARLLDDLGFDVTFYQSARRPFAGEYFGFKVTGIPHGEGFSEFQHGVCDAFYRLSDDYDHVIYNIANYASGRLVRDDAILICHGIWFDYESPSFFSFRTPEWFDHLYNAFSRPRRVVSVDANSINLMRSLWPEVAARMTYLPNWVDTSVFYPPRERDTDTLTIIFPRRSTPLRGSQMLGPILEGITHDCRIWWVGAGEDEDNEHIKALARRDPRLRFYAASFDEMPLLYRQADICCIPTIASEGTSLSCLEALASGCAVVATTVGGLPELIQSGVNGLLVDPQPEKIAAAINSLIEQPALRSRLQEGATRTAKSFCLEIWRERWTELLHQLGWLEHRVQLASVEQTLNNSEQSLHVDSAPVSLCEQEKDMRLLKEDSVWRDMPELSSDNESTRLLKKRALHLNACLTESEEVVRLLNARLTEYEEAARARLLEHDEAVRIFTAQLAAKDVQLQSIRNSRGWRLVTLYSAIKHRYLLRAYRLVWRIQTDENAAK